jgi:hypothetical protein
LDEDHTWRKSLLLFLEKLKHKRWLFTSDISLGDLNVVHIENSLFWVLFISRLPKKRSKCKVILMVLATLVTRWLLIFWIFLVVVGAHTWRTLMWVTFIWTREAIMLSSTILHLILSFLLYKLELSTYAMRFKALNYSCIAKRSFLRILTYWAN